MEDQNTLGEVADNYSTKLKSVADLELVTDDMEIKEDLEAQYPFKYVEVNGEKYKMPNSVLETIRDIRLEDSSKKAFKVNKTGEGIKTKYSVIAL